MEGLGAILLLFLFFVSYSFGLQHENSCNGTQCFQNKTNGCVGSKQNFLTPDDKNYILSEHTSLRENMMNAVDKKLPKAFFIKKLSWNDDLARMAQVWAEKCKATKEPNLFLGNQAVGQLMLTVEEKLGGSLKDLVGKWTAELKHLNEKVIAKYHKPSSALEDYEAVTQMMWWNTSQVGCGRSSFLSKNCVEKGKTCSVVQLVCNYLPAGNREGEPVYLTTNDNNLICQYDNKSIHCKDMGTRGDGENEDDETKRMSFANRIKNRMMELWPAAAGSASVWEGWTAHSLFSVFFISLNLCISLVILNIQ